MSQRPAERGPQRTDSRISLSPDSRAAREVPGGFPGCHREAERPATPPISLQPADSLEGCLTPAGMRSWLCRTAGSHMARAMSDTGTDNHGWCREAGAAGMWWERGISWPDPRHGPPQWRRGDGAAAAGAGRGREARTTSRTARRPGADEVPPRRPRRQRAVITPPGSVSAAGACDREVATAEPYLPGGYADLSWPARRAAGRKCAPVPRRRPGGLRCAGTAAAGPRRRAGALLPAGSGRRLRSRRRTVPEALVQRVHGLARQAPTPPRSVLGPAPRRVLPRRALSVGSPGGG